MVAVGVVITFQTGSNGQMSLMLSCPDKLCVLVRLIKHIRLHSYLVPQTIVRQELLLTFQRALLLLPQRGLVLGFIVCLSAKEL